MSNWEVEYDMEKEAEITRYKQEVMGDYVDQHMDDEMELVDFLILRMYYEGLPSREPRIV